MSGPSIADLDRSTSWHRLATTNLGRLATSIGALPIVVPVHYLVCGEESLVFAVEPDTALCRALDGGVFAFEASGYDDALDRWWTVIARGRASVLGLADPAPVTFAPLDLPGRVVPAVGQANLVNGAEVDSLRDLSALAVHLAVPART